MSSQINPDSIFIFSVLDKLLRDNQNNKELFKKLFQQKKEIINLVQTLKIDAEKYKKLMKKACKSENALTRDCAMEDLLKLKDPKSASILFQWFKDMIDSTGQYIEQQQKRYNDFSSSPVKSKVVPMSSIKETMKQSQIRKTHKNVLKQGDIIQKEVVSLKAADNVLKNCEHLPKTYEEVLSRKMKMISLVNKNMIEGENYKKIIEQYLTKIKNEEVLSDTKLELEGLTHFHGGNVKAWFQEVLEESKSLLSYQKKTLMKLNPALKSSFFGSNIKASQIQSKPPLPHQQSIKKEPVVDNPVKIEPKVQQKEPQIVEVSFAASKIQSKMTDETKPIENREGRRPSESHIEDKAIKEHENAKQTVRSKLASKVKEGKKGEKAEEIQKEPVRLETVFSFAVLQSLLEQNIQNQQMCRQIQERKKAMLEQHKNGVLTAEMYKKNLESMKNTSKNQQFLLCLKIELEMIQDLHEGNIQAWFNAIIMTEQEVEVEDLISHHNDIDITDVINEDPDPEVVVERPKKQISVVKDKKNLSATEQLFVKQYDDQTSKNQDFFLRKMAAYESWLYLYKKSKVPYDSNERLVHYVKEIKKKIQIDLKRIEQDKTINVQAWAKELFPPITQEIFYNNQLQNYKEKDIKRMIEHLEKECQALKSYSANIKKLVNTKNIEAAKKDMSEISENINYLKAWPNGKLEPLPIISSETVKKYNIDSNNLDPNQVEIEVVKIQGVSSSMVLQMFVQNKDPILDVQLKNGMTFAKSGKCSEQAMAEVMKGKGNHIRIALFEKGFFGGLSKIEEKVLTESFNRVNLNKLTLEIKGVVIQCLVKVQMALQPIVTEIEHNTLKKLPAYEHSNFVSEELVKKYLIYSCQSPSEIFQ